MRSRPPLPVEDKQDIKKPVGPLFAVGSLADQQVSFSDANGLILRSVVSTGVEGHPTPEGVFTIIEKERWHRSNIYSGAPMPYMERITFSGVAMHEGFVTGRPASHGCIRLPADFARKLFGITRIGERVVISSETIAPVPIANVHLPVPSLRPLPSAETADRGAGPDGGGAVAPIALAATPPSANEETKLLNPLDMAKALKAEAEAKRAAAAKARKTAAPQLEAALQKVRLTFIELKSAEDALRKAQAELDAANRDVTASAAKEALRQRAEERKSAAETKLASAQARIEAARDADSSANREVLSLQEAIHAAETTEAAEAEVAKEAVRRLEPLSIFISGKTSHLYVRQANVHLFDVPVTIKEPSKRLGTHLFIATAAGSDGASLKWVSLTPPAAVEVRLRRQYVRGRGRMFVAEEAAPSSPFPETPSGALDRIEIPQDAQQRISELVWIGATLIVSDVEMSGEGRYPMDFMILSRTVIREY
jgi:hypothetical protein